MRHRALNRLLARLGGYFWLPCPLCGQPFGGHEWHDVDGLSSIVNVPGNPGSGRGICPDCTAAGFGSDRFDL